MTPDSYKRYMFPMKDLRASLDIEKTECQIAYRVNTTPVEMAVTKKINKIKYY